MHAASGNLYSYIYVLLNVVMLIYCILHGRIKGYNSSITTIMCQGGTQNYGWVVIEC